MNSGTLPADAVCLATDPNDKMSRQELDYIKGLRAKRP